LEQQKRRMERTRKPLGKRAMVDTLVGSYPQGSDTKTGATEWTT